MDDWSSLRLIPPLEYVLLEVDLGSVEEVDGLRVRTVPASLRWSQFMIGLLDLCFTFFEGTTPRGRGWIAFGLSWLGGRTVADIVDERKEGKDDDDGGRREREEGRRVERVGDGVLVSLLIVFHSSPSKSAITDPPGTAPSLSIKYSSSSHPRQRQDQNDPSSCFKYTLPFSS